MVEDVVMRQGLLNHQKVVVVELLQVRRVGEAIRGVGVDGKLNIGEPPAHLFNDSDIPAGLDLDLDALVARRQLRLDLADQMLD